MGLASRKTKDMTVGEGFAAAADFGADVVSGVAGPILSAGQTLVDAATGVSAEEMKRSKAVRDKALDYVPRTELGQGLSDSGKDLIGKGADAFMGFVKDPENAWMFGYMPEGIEAVQNLWNKLPEEARMSVEAGANIGEVLIGGGILSGTKSAAKLTRGDILPDVKNMPAGDIPVSDTTTGPSLLQKPALLLPAARTSPTTSVDELGYTSGIEEAIVTLINDPKTHNTISASNLLNKLTGKNSKVKEDEIEWSTYSDWLKEQGNKQVTLDEALRQAKDRAITLEVFPYKAEGGADEAYGGYIAEGGTNYRELVFKFDTGSDAGELKQGVLKAERYKLIAAREKLIEERAKLLNPRREAMVDNVMDDMDFTEENDDLSASYAIDQDGNALHEDALWYQMDRAVEKELPRNKRTIEIDKELSTLTTQINQGRKATDDKTYQSSHWPGKRNPLFHARVTDREIGGGNSLALDEIQSDWHQGQGNIENRPYYKLPPDKMGPHIETQITQSKVAYKDAEEKVKKAETLQDNILEESGAKSPYELVTAKSKPNFREANKTLSMAENKSEEAKEVLDNHQTQLRILNEEGYQYFTRGLRPNAPLKNKEKWMGAVLNAMLYKAVKEGYDSISWPNGKTNSSLYDGLKPGQIEALEKMYDVTLPTLLGKMVKKIDKGAKIEFGKRSSDSNVKPASNPEDAPIADQEAMEADFEMHERAFGGLANYDMTWERFSRDWVRRDEFGNRIENGTRTEDWQLEEDHEIYLQNLVEHNFVETPDDRPYTLKEYKEKFGYQEYDAVNSAYSHIKITPKMKEVILKGQPLFLAEGGLVTGYNQGGLATDETPTMVTPARISGESPKVPTPVEGDDTAALNAAITAMRKEEAKGSEPTFYDMDDQDFPEEYGAYKTPVADTEEPPMEAAEATPSTSITQTEEALTEAATPLPVPRETDRGLGIASVNTLDGGIKSIVYSVIQSEENDRGVIKDSSNWDTTTKKWLPHASAEGGADTIAYGHKFATQAEADAVTASGGITEAEAVELFKEDMGTAEARAKKEYEVKYPSHKWSSLDTLGKLMLTEVVYNIGTLKDKKGVYDWTNLSAAVRDKDFKAAKGQLSRTYRNKKGVKVSLVKRTNALKAVYEKALPLTDWTK